MTNTNITSSVFQKIREEKLTEEQLFKLTLEEINSLRHSKGQRCGITRENDTANLYHPLEHERFDARVKDVVKSILDKGWEDKLVPFRFALCQEDKEFYIIDGQSSEAACNIIKKECEEEILPEKFSCLYLGYLTLEEIDYQTYLMNGGTPKKDWKASDNIASNIRKVGGKVLQDFNKLKDFQFETKTRETAVDYMFTGKYINRNTKAQDFKLRKYYDLYADFYRTFVNESGKVYVNDEIILEDKKLGTYQSRHTITRTEGLAKHLMQSLDLCVYVCEKHNLNPCTYLPLYGKKLMDDVFNNGNVRYKTWDDMVLTPKTRFVDFARKAKLYPTISSVLKHKLPVEVTKKDCKDFLSKRVAESELGF